MKRMQMKGSNRFGWMGGWMLALLAAILVLSSRGMAATPRVSIGLPGAPPVWAGVVAYVAQDEGYFHKFGVDVTIRPFSSGAGAARAVAAGSIDLALAPAAPVVKMVANGGVQLVGVWGMEHPDWLLGSTVDKTSCSDLKGHAVGVDSVGGARWIQLIKVLHFCHMTPRDVKVVSLSSGVAEAMVAGTLKYGVLHQSDVPVIQRQGHKHVYVVKTIREISPDNQYLILVTVPQVIRENRTGLVRFLAAMDAATRFMHKEANYQAVARIAMRHHISDADDMQDSVQALKDYEHMGFWPVGHSGLSRIRIEKTIKIQVKVGGIKRGSSIPSFSKLTDLSLWRDAKRLAARHGM